MDSVLLPKDLPGPGLSRVPGLPVPEAKARVTDVERVAKRLAKQVLAASLARTGGGIPALALPIDAGEALDLPSVADIVASLSLMYVAETARYRDALLATADRMDIEVHRYEPASVAANPAWTARLSPPRTWTRGSRGRGRAAGRVGTLVGRPWRCAHKEAALGAWLTTVLRSAR